MKRRPLNRLNGMFPGFIAAVFSALLLITAPAALSHEVEEDTIDRALAAIALKRSDLRMRTDLSTSPHALPHFLRWMENPLNAPPETQKIALQLFEASQKPSVWVRNLAGFGGMGTPESLALQKCTGCIIPQELPAAMREALLHLLDAIYTVNRSLASFRKNIPSRGMGSIEQNLYPDFLRKTMDGSERMDIVKPREVKEAIEVAGHLDRKAMMDAALMLVEAVERCSELLADQERFLEIRSFSFDTPMGVVEVGGKGSDVHSRDAILVLDLGGNDIYTGKVAAGVNGRCGLVLDLEGDDLYAGEDFTQGTGFWSVGILVDLQGNDTYKAGNCAQGAGLFGVGLLIDAEGNDLYIGGRFVQAASAWGLGGLLDLSGEDVYQCESSGQAFSGVLGLSSLCDLHGNDRYISGLDTPDPREPGMNQSFSQGFSTGMRNLAAGGFSLLADRSGNDHYYCQYFGQGSSYWMGAGLLYDHEGNDTYVARRYGQGAGIHYAFGMLMDAGGDDQTSSWGVSQGCGHDYGIGVLINHFGNDTYVSDWTSTGASEANGIGIFLESGGNDGYEVRSGMGMGHLTATRRAGGLGLFADAGGKDRYSVRGLDNTTWASNRWGVGIDENEGTFRMGLLKTPLSIAVERGIGERRKERLRPGKILEEAGGLPASERLESLLAAASNWTIEEETSRRAQEELLQMDPAVSVPFMAQLLDTPDVMVFLFLEKLFSVHAFHAVRHLMEKTSDSNPAVKSAALHLLSVIKDPTTIDSTKAALHDPDWRVRSAAIRASGEMLNTVRFENLLLLRDSLQEAMEKGDPLPLKEYTNETTCSLVLSVLVCSVPVRYMDYRSFASSTAGDDFIDSVFLHRMEVLRLLDRWIGVMISEKHEGREIGRYLFDSDPAVRRNAVYALGQMQYRPALRDIVFFLSDSDPWVRDAAVLSLAMFRDESVPFVNRAMKRGESSMIILSLDVLGRIGSEAAQEIIRYYTSHEDPNVRRMAESALGS